MGGRSRGDEDWFLTASERGNQFTGIDRRHPDGLAWTNGNQVQTLIHGAAYFHRLLAEVKPLGKGDQLYFTDWRGDPDERLDGSPETEVGVVLSAAIQRGVNVKGLVWRSHADRLGFSEKENRHLARVLNEAGGEVLLDQRVRLGGSHHQKLVIVRHEGESAKDIAFVGGIDLCHSRRDDSSHDGDPQTQPMPGVFGGRPPWHDVQVAVQGPAVGDLEYTFRERWSDPGALSRDPAGILHDLLSHADRKAGPLPRMPPDPPARGPHAVQVLRTYGRRWMGYPFAREGERSIARGYHKALRRARRLVYVEDQYLWSEAVMAPFVQALRANPQLRLIAVVPRYFDQGSPVTLPPNQVGRELAVRALLDAGGDRVAIFDVENPQGVPVYVHAKVCVIDDVWTAVGSDNFNRRSWGHDSEIACAVLDSTRDQRAPADPAGLGDGARTYARDLRLALWREHLGRDEGDDADLLDPDQAVKVFRETAAALETWHRGGGRGERPPGRVRPHPRIRRSMLTRLWAEPMYRVVYDPDSRPLAMRRAGEW